jgi:hypothetical protein
LPSIYQSEITEANTKKLKACKQILISLYGTWHLMIDRMHIVKSAKRNQDSDHENWSPKKPLLRLKTLQVIALDTFTQGTRHAKQIQQIWTLLNTVSTPIITGFEEL